MERAMRMAVAAGLGVGACGGLAAGQQSESADQTRAIVAEMMRDAETRSNLLSAGDGGHDENFFLAGDGFRLNVGGFMQFRYYANVRDDANGNGFEPGFQTRRTRLIFDGTINKDWSFMLHGDFSKSDGTFVILDAYAGYAFANGVKVRWGQFKLPLLREEMVSDTCQLTIERSVTNNTFTQDRSQGVQLGMEEEKWRWWCAFSDGLNSKNTDFSGAGESTTAFKVRGEADYALTARCEFRFGAEGWKQFKDFTSPRGSEFAWLLGFAAHWQQSENTSNPADTDRDTFEFTGDLSLEGDGWNGYGAFIGRYSNLNTLAGTDSDFTDFGGLVQGGVRIAENTELFARWDAIFPDSDRGLPEDAYHFITGGVTQFFAGHAVQATLDVVYSVQQTNSDLTSIGVLPDSGAGLLSDVSEGEFVVRLQFQIVF